MGFFDRLFRRTPRSPKEVFADQVLAALAANGVRHARYDAERFAIRYNAPGRSEVAWMYLANLYAECERDPEHRYRRIKHFVRAFAAIRDAPTTWDEVRDLLRPVLRGASFGRTLPRPGATPIRRPALPFLDELVVVDQPDSMAYVTDITRAPWGVTAEQVFATARANLQARAALPPADPADGPVLVRFVDSGDAYWVSHLLLNGWLAALAERVGGRPVAFAPDQSSLTVVADEPEALAKVYELVGQEFAGAPRGLTPAAYTIDSGGLVVPYEAPHGHPLRRVVGRSERILAGHEYAAQSSVLDHLGVAEEVAECAVYTRTDGSAFTLATWRIGEPTLLPRVDLVAVASAGEMFTVPWAALAEVDAVVEAPEYRPARYRTLARPSPNALGYLRERTTQP